MKHFITLLLLFGLFAISPAMAQTKRLTSRINQWYDIPTGLPAQGDSITIAYNSNHEQEQLLFWKFNNGSYSMTSRFKDYTFDANGNLLYFLVQAGDDINGFTDETRSTFTFDANSNILSELVESWNGTDWHAYFGLDYTYDANGKLLTKGGDICSYTIFYTYNAQNQLVTELKQTGPTSNLVDNALTEYTYATPADVNPATKTEYYRVGNAWESLERYTYTYDAHGNVTQSVSEWWDAGTSTWNNDQLVTYSFDANQNNTGWVQLLWNGGSWGNFIKNNLVYDADSDIVSSDGYFGVGTDWVKWSESRHHYTLLVGAYNPALADFLVYPNPVSSVLVLKSEGLAQAQIFDSNGLLMRSQQLSGRPEETVRVSDLPAGNYFLQVSTGDGKTGVKPLQIRR